MNKKLSSINELEVEVEYSTDEDDRGTYAVVEGVFAVAGGKRVSDDLMPILVQDVIDTLAEQATEDMHGSDRAPDGRDWMDVAKEDR